MDKDREILHTLIDGDAPTEDKVDAIRRLQEEPLLRRELDDLMDAIRIIEEGGRIQAPANFTAQVMRKLPRQRVLVWKRISDFFLQGRVLRWNMAAASAALIATFALSVALIQQYDAGRRDALPLHTAKEFGVIVRLMLHAPQAGKVAVAGDFNKWNTESHLLQKQNGGVWSIEVPLSPGTHAYMFILNGEAWVTDPDAESYQDDGFGHKNAVKRVRT